MSLTLSHSWMFSPLILSGTQEDLSFKQTIYICRFSHVVLEESGQARPQHVNTLTVVCLPTLTMVDMNSWTQQQRMEALSSTLVVRITGWMAQRSRCVPGRASGQLTLQHASVSFYKFVSLTWYYIVLLAQTWIPSHSAPREYFW